MKKVIFIIVLLSVSTAIVTAQQESRFSIHATPEAEIPLTFGSELFTTGAGIDLGLELRMPFWEVLGLQADLVYSYMPLRTGDGVNFLNGGGGLSFTLPRIGEFLVPAVFANAGYYFGIIADNDASSGGNLYFSGGGRLSWALSPNYNLGLEVQYKNYLDGLGGMLHHGINVGISSSFNFHDSGSVDIINTRIKEIFPVQYKYYAGNSIGSIELNNSGSVPIEDIRVSVFIEKYMDNPTETAGPEVLAGGDTAVIDLYALFSEEVLGITEATIVSSEIVIDYAWNEKEKQFRHSEPIRLYDRHAMTWDDTRKAAAFVNYKDPSVIAIGKMLSHLVKSTVNVFDVNLCTAAALHQALGSYGLEYVIDPTSPFTEFSGDAMAVDYIQFPSNTLEFRSGDCDDLSILYTAVLQSVGIDTAFITVPGHIFIAFALKIAPEQAVKAISNPEDIIEYGDRAWIPLEITMVANPFLQAWKAGANQWNEYDEKGQAELIPMSSSWTMYEPVGFGSGKAESFISEDEASVVYMPEIERFISREIYAQTEPINERMKSRGESARSLNKLGSVYARYGKNEKAGEYFDKALELEDYYPALVNKGNLLLLDNDLQAAVETYRRAEQISSRSAALYLQMSRAYSGMGMFDKASDSFSRVRELNPDLAEKYAFIDMSGGTSRASGYSITDGMIWLDEED